ncbi:MAG: DUF1080 domain-containing protein, partial [Phycisphaerae bacterium]|nr:DUF1080 domain-containing protein [Phycisphaerae bacterium]
RPSGEIRTDRMYQNFILELEWRHLKPKGNAGVFVWADDITARGQPFHRGIEVQVLENAYGNTKGYTTHGDIFPIHGAKMIALTGHRSGKNGRAFPTERRSNPSPQWNHYRIHCQDGRISLAVNGKVVTKGHEAMPRKGYICLESEGGIVHYRNIRIKQLPDTPVSPEQVAVANRDFKTLYNGIDLSGWKVHDGLVGHWKPRDWVLEYDGQATGKDKNLWTKQSFRNFTLIVDWRFHAKYPKTMDRPVLLPTGDSAKNPDGSTKTVPVPIADSGIFLRGSPKAQINIWQWPVGSGEIWGYRTDAKMPAEIRAACTPKLKADEKPGRWNRFEITMKGEIVTVILNGKTVIDRARLPGVPAEGPIALQHHGDPIQFANIYVRQLPDD